MRIGIISTGVVVSLALSAATVAAQQNVPHCIKPWAIPDKWIDNHDVTAPIDNVWTVDDTFETVDEHGNPLLNPDVYVAPSQNGPGTGFTVASDLGLHLTLKVGDVSLGMRPGWFFAVDVGTAGAGGNAYRQAIGSCDSPGPHFGDFLSVLMGNLHGPTVQGTADLISLDPTAFWDPTAKVIASGCAASGSCVVSPRLGAVAVFNPALFEQTKHAAGGPHIQVTNVIGVFVDGVVKGTVTGYLTALPGLTEP